MDNAPISPWFAAALSVLWIASILIWERLIAKRRRDGVILPYEPRTPVPWGGPIALLIVIYVAASLISAHGAEPAIEPVDDLSPSDVIRRLSEFMIFQTVVTVGVCACVAAIFGAKRQDFGLPISVTQLFRDIKMGVVAWLASILPVHGLQLVLLILFGLQKEPPSHPLFEMIAPAGPNFLLFLIAAIVAVVIAPVSEEVFFRMLFQGWLEKSEAWRVLERTASIQSPDVSELAPATVANDEFRMTNDESPQSEDQSAVANSSFDIRHSLFSSPPSRGLASLPYGWLPISLSSVIFAVAHVGHGPDPIPIFFLALILGYVYQRTHRIVPCIVAHMLFNSLAMLVLWQLIFVNAK